MTNDSSTPTTWRIEQAGADKHELVDAGSLGPENLQSSMIYRLISPDAENLSRQEKVSLLGILICACGYYIALDTSIGFKGFLDLPSKHLETCPQCHRGMMLAGETTGKENSEKQWLIVTPTSGKEGIVEMPGTPSGLPILSIAKIERIADLGTKAEKRKDDPNNSSGGAEEPTSKEEKPKDQMEKKQESKPNLAPAKKEPITIKSSDHHIWDMAISPDSSYFVSTDLLDLKIWDMKTGKEMATLSGHTSPILSCAISPDAKFIVTACGIIIGSGESTLKIWDASTGQERVTLLGHKEFVGACAISPNGNFIVSASRDRTLKIWDVATGSTQATLKGHKLGIQGCSISPDSSFIVSRSADKTLKIWDTKSGRTKATLKGHADQITKCAFSYDSSFIVSASKDCTLKIWDVATGKIHLTFEGHTKTVNDFVISPDNSFIVSASSDGTLKLWDAESGDEHLTFLGHEKGVFTCAISPDSTFIVSGSHEVVKLWNTSDGNVIATLGGLDMGANKCFISSDSSYIISKDGPSTMYIWDLRGLLSTSPQVEETQTLETFEQSLVEEKPKSSVNDRLPSEIINELFDRQQLDLGAKKILAAVLLCEWTPTPFVWTGPGPDPYSVGSENEEIRQFRFLLSKILPGYQPHFIPGQLMITSDTVIAGRQFEAGENLDVGITNPMLAVMLADLLEDHGVLENLDLSTCSALSISGNSPATGEARIALVVK